MAGRQPRPHDQAQPRGQHGRVRRFGNRRHRVQLHRIDAEQLAADALVDDAAALAGRVAVAQPPGQGRVEPVVDEQVGPGAERRPLVRRVIGLERTLAGKLEAGQHLAVDGGHRVVEQESGALEVARGQVPAAVELPALRIVAADQVAVPGGVAHPHQREGRPALVDGRVEVERGVARLAGVQIGEDLVAGAKPALELAFEYGVQGRVAGLRRRLRNGKGQRQRAGCEERLHDHLLTGFTDRVIVCLAGGGSHTVDLRMLR